MIFEYGDEHRSRRIAARSCASERSPIETTDQLARVVAGAVGRRPGGPHPARRTFQALRIAVNRELEELAASLPHATRLLVPGGRVVVISYHSLEDGIVKRAFRDDPGFRALDEEARRRHGRRGRREPSRPQRQASRRGADRGGRVSTPARKLETPASIPIPRVRPSRTPAARPPRATPPRLIGGRAAAPRSPSGSWWPSVAGDPDHRDRLAVGAAGADQFPGR